MFNFCNACQQRICRDACGNIRVTNGLNSCCGWGGYNTSNGYNGCARYNSCGWNRCNSCNTCNGCFLNTSENTSNSTTSGNSGNGCNCGYQYGCVTVCGYGISQNNTTANTSSQSGQTGRCRRSSCYCGYNG
ncbi:MAG: hypothetical protein IJY63_04990 [Clostridia bacterium]|nr:hypothetical protein [Clostridia bacterium]